MLDWLKAIALGIFGMVFATVAFAWLAVVLVGLIAAPFAAIGIGIAAGIEAFQWVMGLM